MPAREIVAALDARQVETSPVNRELVQRAAGDKRLHGGRLVPTCRALIVTRAGMVYSSLISASTLARKMTFLQERAKSWRAET